MKLGTYQNCNSLVLESLQDSLSLYFSHFLSSSLRVGDEDLLGSMQRSSVLMEEEMV